MQPTEPNILWDKWVDPYEDIVENSEKIPIFDSEDGPVPVTTKNRPGVQYNFWLGHTNFPITKPVANILNFFPGVESLDIFSPYRFRISIGKNFNQENVKYGIENAFKPKEKTKNAIISRHIKSAHWAIVKDGKTTKIIKGNSIEEVDEKCKKFQVLSASE